MREEEKRGYSRLGRNDNGAQPNQEDGMYPTTDRHRIDPFATRNSTGHHTPAAPIRQAAARPFAVAAVQGERIGATRVEVMRVAG
jgi:hypothetical protein